MKGTIFNIEEMTVHDGAGARLTVFLKGCPLRCEWCHNPEGWISEPQLVYNREKCVDCGLCKVTCTHKECRPFGRCLHVCPKDCLNVCGEEYDSKKLANKINAYKRIFAATGGGVTFSGGEPLMQWKFLSETIDFLDGVHTVIETCGYADEETFAKMLKKIDFVYMDLKLFDGELHKKYTGADNAVIKNNFKSLKDSGKPFVVRTPLIKGVTDGEENLRKIKEFIGDSEWEKLPENELAKSKRSWFSCDTIKRD